MAQRRILAVSADPASLDRLVEVLARAGVAVEGLAESVVLERGTVPHDRIFYAWDGAPGPLARILPCLRPEASLVAVVPAATLSALTAILRLPGCDHALVGGDHERDLAATARKLASDEIFGIEQYLPEGTQVSCVRMDDFRGRTAAIDTILRHAEEQGVRRQVRSAIGQVCEELLMNALYDAPVDEAGNLVFGEVDPRARVERVSPRPVSIRYAATEHRFAVAVRDRFGRLDKDTILAYIDKCLSSPQQIDRKTYGAGLGLYLVANAATGYVVNVARGAVTEVVCTFDRGLKGPLKLVGVFTQAGESARRPPPTDAAGAS